MDLLGVLGIVGLLLVALGIALLAWPTAAAGAFLFVASETIEFLDGRKARKGGRS